MGLESDLHAGLGGEIVLLRPEGDDDLVPLVVGDGGEIVRPGHVTQLGVLSPGAPPGQPEKLITTVPNSAASSTASRWPWRGPWRSSGSGGRGCHARDARHLQPAIGDLGLQLRQLALGPVDAGQLPRVAGPAADRQLDGIQADFLTIVQRVVELHPPKSAPITPSFITSLLLEGLRCRCAFHSSRGESIPSGRKVFQHGRALAGGIPARRDSAEAGCHDGVVYDRANLNGRRRSGDG